ncbi:MAG: hypothetical protein Sylvanvirus22_3 [Sylvanvirus sp.]|uniref:Uncharacterized protein n=1 Tax=Sylvanvirus sp. TaxID=2487774 RepID=A0A3G5AJR2_9VIRU|nr:MAG: hypothetical protein Sylvanvirus22_3 [Sylvanvirus sp.]
MFYPVSDVSVSRTVSLSPSHPHSQNWVEEY